MADGFALEHLTRQLDLVPPEVLGTQLNIVGCGAIGSWAALFLVKMGFSQLTLWDPDTVDLVNMSCQAYTAADVGRSKPDVLRARLRQEATETAIQVQDREWAGAPLPGITLACADSMAVRRRLWEVLAQYPACRLVVDVRMGAEQLACYTYRPHSDRSRKYEASLHSDANSVHVPCTARATMYTAAIGAALATKAVRDYLVGECEAGTTVADIKTLDWVTDGR